MDDLIRLIEEMRASDSEFKRGYDRLGPLYDLIKDVIGLRLDAGLTQKDVSERMGKQQPAVARFEAGNTVPTLTFLQDIAEALDARLVVRIEPVNAASGTVPSDNPVTTGAAKASKPQRRRAVRA